MINYDDLARRTMDRIESDQYYVEMDRDAERDCAWVLMFLGFAGTVLVLGVGLIAWGLCG